MDARQIRKEVAQNIKEKQSTAKTTQDMNRAVNEARAEANTKYGQDWCHTRDSSKNGSSWIGRGKKNR